MRLQIAVPGEPVPKARPRFNRSTGKVYTPRETTEFESTIAWTARSTGVKFGAEPLKVALLFHCSPRKRMPDLDNLVKSALDGLVSSGVIPDDIWVTSIAADRYEASGSPLTSITVETLSTLTAA